MESTKPTLNEAENGNKSKPLLQDVFSLREWMPFSDQEISIFQHYIMDYFLENDEATIPDAFQYVLKNIRQYSGFKDRNGTEIYEGDIFIYNYTLDGTQRKTKKVEFDKEVGAWYLGGDLLSAVLVEQNNDDWKKSQNYKIKENQYLIISGNIYDNPNLLQ